MKRIALRMLFGDRGKYLSLVIGLSFAVLLICQQAAIFLGLITRATGILQNVGQPDLWVADPYITYIGEIRPLSERDLGRIRSIPGVAWAEPFFTARAVVELPDDSYKTVELIGIDRSTMIGQPPEMTEGRLADLRIPDAVLVEESSRPKLADVQIGDTLLLNDRRAIVVGFCRAKAGFESNAILYTTFQNAIGFVPTGRDKVSFYLVKTKPDADVQTVARGIEERTGLGAFTYREMQARTVRFILVETGIGINFGITVLLGFFVGLAVVAAVFYQFTLENLRHFAVLKAMGARTRALVGMVLLQGLVVGVIGYGIGVGLAGLFTLSSRKPGAELSAQFPWPLLVGSIGAMLICIGLGSVLSLRRVITLEPAVVFK
mgnify:CR=1 FL=1